MKTVILRIIRMEPFALIVLIACWVLWAWPFLVYKARTPKREAEVTALSSSWGMALQMVGYFFVWLPGPQPRPAALTAAGILIGILAVVISWTSIRALGKQLRVN